MKAHEKPNPILQIKSRLEEAAPAIIDDRMSTLHAPGPPAAGKVRIYEILLDRLMGKPEATIRLEDGGRAMEEAEQMISAIAEEIRGGGSDA